MNGSEMSIYEIIMLMCFGAAWPFSILKSYRSKQIAGKSVAFLFIVLFGYAAGILHKVHYLYDRVTILYFLNGGMVLIDICLYYRNKRLLSRQGS